MDYNALAKQFGAIQQPKAQPAQGGVNWMDGLSPKDQAELKMKRYNDSAKRISSLDEEITKGESISNDLERFGQLNRNSRTGGFVDSIFPGTPLFHGADENEMYSIQARLGPSQRAVGSGASTEKDVALFLSGLPRIEQEGDVNKNIRLEFNKRYAKAVEKKDSMQKYLDQYGNLDGFDTDWARAQSQAKDTPPKAATTIKSLPIKPPKGVGPEIWKYSTPEQRKLWMK